MFVQPRSQYVLRGHLTLNVLSPDFGNENSDGDPREPLENCFKLENGAKLLNNGKEVLVAK